MALLPKFQDATCIQLDGLEVATDLDFDELCESLWQQVHRKAKAAGLQMPAVYPGESAHSKLLMFFQDAKQAIVVQLDNLEHVLSPRCEDGSIDKPSQENVLKLMKSLLFNSSLYVQWTVTGSAMALLWMQLSLMPVHGIAPLHYNTTVHLPLEHDKRSMDQLVHMMPALRERVRKGDIMQDCLKAVAWASNCVTLTMSVEEYCSHTSMPMEQIISAIETQQIGPGALAEWIGVVREMSVEERARLKGLYDTTRACSRQFLDNSPRLQFLYKSLTTPVEGKEQYVYLTSPFYRGALAMCLTPNGCIAGRLPALSDSEYVLACDAFVQLVFIVDKAAKLVRTDDDRLVTRALQAPAEQLLEKEGPAAHWPSKTWFKCVLYSKFNQGLDSTRDALGQDAVWHNAQGTARKYLQDVVSYGGCDRMPAARQLAWYLRLLRNVLCQSEGKLEDFEVFPAVLGCVKLLQDSPVVQPFSTVVTRLADIRLLKIP